MSERGTVDGGHALAVVGSVLVVVGGTFYWWETLLGGASLSQMLFELFTHVWLPASILAIGLLTTQGRLEPRDTWLVAAWGCGGAALLAGLVLWANLDALLAGEYAHFLYDDLLVYGSLGGVFGGIAGTNRAHAAQNRRLVDLAESQRETLAVLTHLLRHDVRNDLTVVTGATEVLEDYVDEDGESWLSTIDERMDRTLDLLDRVGSVSESLADGIETTPVRLAPLIERERAALAEEYPHATVEVDVPHDLRVTAGDLLPAVFANLLRNALRHNTADEPRVEVTATATDGTVTVRVADNGPGIDDERKERVFEMGERDPRSDGDGLGLYLVERLVEGTGGTVSVRDNRPCGTVFEVRLPAT